MDKSQKYVYTNLLFRVTYVQNKIKGMPKSDKHCILYETRNGINDDLACILSTQLTLEEDKARGKHTQGPEWILAQYFL